MTINEWLRQKVKERSMTQQELAEALGVSQTAVYRYLKGDIEPSIKNIKKLAKIFDTPESELLGLKWQDIDWEKQTISIEKTLTYLKGEFILEEPKTKGSCRTIPLFPEAVEVRELPPPIEVVASWSMLPSGQDYPRSKGCSFPSFTNYMANFSRFFDAFISLSCIAPQSGHFHSLNAKFFTSAFLYPHLLHIR